MQRKAKDMLSGMSCVQARNRIIEIFSINEPGVDFETKYPGIYVWMESREKEVKENGRH